MEKTTTKYNSALTSNRYNNSQSCLRSYSYVIILNLAQIKFSISFLDQLINIFMDR